MGFTVADIIGVPLQASTESAATYAPTVHLPKQLQLKGISLSNVLDVLRNPSVVTPARGDGHQRRFTARGLAVIVDDSKKVIVTVYPDQQINPLREDQKANPRAMAWARKNGLSG